MDTHFVGLGKLGANFELRNNNYLKFQKTHWQIHIIKEASVTGTANIIMAAVMAQGTTTVYNAAVNPMFNNFAKC